MDRHRAAWTTALAIGIALIAAGSAHGFQFKSCVSHDGSGPCTSIGNSEALNFPASVVVSPDGRHVYSSALVGDAVAIFARDPNDGALSFRGCVRGPNDAGPCVTFSHARALDGARPLAMSPNGRQLYVGAQNGDALTWFTRDPDTGALSAPNCMSTNGGGCTSIHSGALDDPYSLAISPDGDELYAAAWNGRSIGYFSRNQDTGALGFFSCRGVASLCVPVPDASALEMPKALAVSGDGRHLYSAAENGDAIAVFRPDTSLNTLNYVDCYGATAAGGCISIGNSHALDGPASLVVSPDDAHLFVASSAGNAIGSFGRNAETGELGFIGCDGLTNLGPCTGVGNANALTNPSGLAISPTGGRVYGSAQSGNAIASFARSLSAEPLAFIGCVGADGSGPCTSANNSIAIASPIGVAASPDGRHLYVAASGGSISVIGIAPPACAPLAASTPFQTAIRVKLECSDPDGGDAVGYSVGGAANGTLSELDPVGGTVLFTPNPGFSGAAGFRFTASDVDGSTTIDASIGVGAAPFVPRPPRTRRLRQTIKTRWAFNRTHTWVVRLQVLRVPGDARVQVRCKAPKRLGKKACPFKRKSAKPKRHRATVDLRKEMFRKQRKLRAGVQLQIRITAPGAIGKVVTYKLRPSKLPRSVERCLPPGASKPQKRC
jgi:6-phosphogluconolactonase (cycloisomerase 2 family)